VMNQNFISLLEINMLQLQLQYISLPAGLGELG
jgi:hypothetical protein